MILGYFGKTPTDPNPEIMKIASEQLSLKPTQEDVHDLNDDNSKLGIEYNKKLLEEKGLETSDENQMLLLSTCVSAAKFTTISISCKSLDERYPTLFL